MAKLIHMTIDECTVCPHMFRNFNTFLCSHIKAYVNDKSLACFTAGACALPSHAPGKYTFDIPGWCPLEDAPEK